MIDNEIRIRTWFIEQNVTLTGSQFKNLIRLVDEIGDLHTRQAELNLLNGGSPMYSHRELFEGYKFVKVDK